MSPFRGGWIVWLSLLFAMLLAVAHLPHGWPEWLSWLRPNWVLLVLFYWALEHPQRFGPLGAWILGLLLDALLAQPLGLNAMLFAVLVYSVVGFSDRLRMFSQAQQCLVVLLIVLCAEGVRALVLNFSLDQSFSWGLALTALASMLWWPFIAELLLRTRVLGRVD